MLIDDPVWFVIVCVVTFAITTCASYILNHNQHHNLKHLENEIIRLRLELDRMRLGEPKQATITSRTKAETRVEEILQIVGEDPKTARQIRSTLGQSREHVARLVKKMTDAGYLERLETRPFTYVITDRGKTLLK